MNMRPGKDTFLALKRLLQSDDFTIFINFMESELSNLRKESDNLPDLTSNLISQGRRQALMEIIELSSQKAVEEAFKRMRADADLTIPESEES